MNTPEVCAAGDILLDGGFEAATGNPLDSPDWTESSTQFGSPLCTQAICGTILSALPRTGTVWAWFGGTLTFPEVAGLSQTVTFPTGATSVTLNFYLWIGAVNTPFTDTLEVQVDGVTQQTYTEPAVAEVGYSLRSVDLSAFADGASHTINFLYTLVNPGGGTSNFSVDDVSLDVVCPIILPLTPTALAVDPIVNGTSNGNGVLELNEDAAVIDPTWTNNGGDYNVTGVASNLTGPGVALTFTITDTTADYGLIPAGTSADCLSATGDCYAINVAGVRTDQPVHLDLTLDETITAIPPATRPAGVTPSKTWVLHVGNSFGDVSTDLVADPYYPSIETVLHKGVTAGCGDGTVFCPTDPTTRAQMAVFLLKASLGSTYDPPDCAGIFTDVPCTPGVGFSDWIEDLYTRGITGGCQTVPTLMYCPDRDVLRSEMAVFLLKASQISGYVPPACASVFTDVPCPATVDFPFSDWIEDLYGRGITGGCQTIPTLMYCPDNNALRQEMAVFLTKTFSLVLYGP